MCADVQNWQARQRLAHALLGFGVVVCGMLVLHPALVALFPVCPIHKWFGILCPGCGVTRAMVSLLHGHVDDAFRWNAFFVTLLPLGVGFTIESYRRAVLHRNFKWPRIPAPAMYAIAVAGFTFMVIRNLA